MKPGITDTKYIERILLVRSDGIGDFILSLPALNLIRASFPTAYICLFTGSWQEEVARAAQLFDEVIIWDGYTDYYLTSPKRVKYLSYSMLRYIARLKSHKFDLAIDFKDNPLNRFIMWASGAKLRLGFNRRWLRSLLNLTIDCETHMHKTLAYLRLVSLVTESGSNGRFIPTLQNRPDGTVGTDGVGRDSARAGFIFNILEEDRKIAENFLVEEGVSDTDKIVIIHPVARWQAKAWPKAKFAQLSDRLLSLPQVRVIFIGAKEDVGGINEVKEMMHKKPVISAGKLNILQAAALIQKASVFIGNDAAPMHIAGILGIPTIALFGPTDPMISSPQGEKSVVIRKIAKICADCFKKNPGRCLYPDNFCMDKISVEEVLDICMTYIKVH